MASGEPSACLMKQIQLAVCQLCGRGMGSPGHGYHEPKTNYQKQVDAPIPPYSQIIPDQRYDEIEAEMRRRKGIVDDGKKIPLQVCVQIPVSGSNQQAAPPTAHFDTKTPQKDQLGKDADNSATVKAACLPCGGCPPPVKMMLCLPCPPPDMIAGASGSGGAGGGFQSGGGGGGGGGGGYSSYQQRKKPKDYTYRCESRELRGGQLYTCCQCIKRNGLQHDCPRTPCQGRPPCLVKPWPDCWPSGGCHGIDYSRENGTKRYDPCMEQRFDKKVCGPGGSGGGAGGGAGGSGGSGAGGFGKPDCGGNMMVVVCPPPAPC